MLYPDESVYEECQCKMKAHRKAARACDSCRIRKVKCDNASPCSQCTHFSLPCVISSAEKKRKNPIRGRLVAQARGDVEQVHGWAGELGELGDAQTASPNSASDAPKVGSLSTVLSSPHIYNREFFIRLLPKYEEIVYPFNPILAPSDIAATIDNMEHSLEDQALVYAFASVTTFLAQRWDDTDDLKMLRMDELMLKSLDAHRMADLRVGSDGHMVEEPQVSINRIMTCVFLEVSMMAFRRFSRSFCLLREAITMIQIFQIDKHAKSNLDASKYQRLYWEAYIHERFLTIAAGYPSILRPLPSGFPTSDPSIPAHVELGFNRLIALFLVMDEPLLAYWQGEQQSNINITAEWIENKQMLLDEDESSAIAAEEELQNTGRGSLTELQHTDLFITRLWLRILVWQLALSRGLLWSSLPNNVHEGLSLHFPAQRLSTQLRSLVSRLNSIASIGTQGSGIIQKLFEITSTIADVLALPLGCDQEIEQASTHVEDFIFLVKFIFQFEQIREQQKIYLREKMELLRQLYPAVNDTVLY